MKLVHREFEKNGSGSVTMVPEEGEDLWHVYNLVRAGDLVRCTTVRKVQRESASGATDSEKIKLTLEVEMEGEAEFDPASYTIRIRGKNKTDTPHVRMHSYHTLELCVNRKFSLKKEVWDEMDLQTVDKACDPKASADMAAVIMTEGLANVCLVTESMTLVRQKVETTIPRKRVAAAFGHKDAVNKFYGRVMQAMLQHIDLSVVKVPGSGLHECRDSPQLNAGSYCRKPRVRGFTIPGIRMARGTAQ